MSSPKIALINPGKSARFAVQEPLNLGFIAAYLEKNGFQVKIIDQLAGDDVRKMLEEYKPDIAGITATTPLAYEAYETAKLTKSMNILTVMGGVHATVFPEEAIKHVDIVVKGEGERAMLDIAQGKIKQGIVCGAIIEKLDEIPIPARHLMHMEKYLYCKRSVPYIGHLTYVAASKKIVHILSSRACPHGKCIFCHNSWKGLPFRMDSPEKTISEIKYMKEKHGIDAIYYVEDNFFGDRPRAMKLCELIIKEGLDKIIWGASARADCVELEMLKLAKRAGCRSVTMGIESGSPRILELLKKGITVDQAKKAIAIVREAGLIAHGNFIFGNPTETEEDIRMTLDFIKETKLTFPEVYLFTPYPGSEIWNTLQEQGVIPKENDWSTFTQEKLIMNASKVPTRTLEKLRTQLYMHYLLTHPLVAAEILYWSLIHPKALFTKAIMAFSPWLGKAERA